MPAYALNIDALGELDDHRFFQLCRDNPELKFERSADGELIVMALTGGETGRLNAALITDLSLWNRQSGLGFCFDSSTGFRLPNGAERSPDLAWVEKSRWLALTEQQRERFPPIAPDFVAELRSPSGSLVTLQNKMREYMDNGVRLAWLFDRERRCVEIYRAGQQAGEVVEVRQAPLILSGEDVLPGFELNFSLS